MEDKDKPIPSPYYSEFTKLPPQEVIDELQTVLFPASFPLINRIADIAKRWGMDTTMTASNGMKFSFRASEYVTGGKERAVAALNVLVARFDTTEKDELKKALEVLLAEIISHA